MSRGTRPSVRLRIMVVSDVRGRLREAGDVTRCAAAGSPGPRLTAAGAGAAQRGAELPRVIPRRRQSLHYLHAGPRPRGWVDLKNEACRRLRALAEVARSPCASDGCPRGSREVRRCADSYDTGGTPSRRTTRLQWGGPFPRSEPARPG